MMITAQRLRDYTSYMSIKDLGLEQLEYAILLAEAKLKEVLCYPDLGADGTEVPAELLFAVKRIAEFYAYDMGEESQSLKSMQSERMGDYSYTKRDSTTTLTGVLATLQPILTQFNQCEKPLGSSVVKMRRL